MAKPRQSKEIVLQDVSVDERQLRRELAEGLGLPAELILREQGRNAEYELYREDIGWLRLGVGDSRDATPENRQLAVKKSRVYATYDSLCKQTIQLYTVYAVGAGIKWQVGDEEKGQALIDEFTGSAANKRFFSAQNQRQMSMQLLIDGEIFFALFVSPEAAETKVRTFDVLQMTDIACDPEDEATPRYYKRVFRKGGKEYKLWYRDWENEDKKNGEGSRGKLITDTDAEPDIVVYHVKLDSIGKRGNPLLTSVFDMAKANRQFIRARLAIIMALAQFAWILKVKGGQAAINALAAAYGSTLGTGEETQPPAAAGSTWLENEGAARTPVKQETGAQAAQVDGAMLLQRFGSGVGIYPHYYGAGESFRLATATAMEPPMLKTFGSYSDLIVSIYRDIFGFILRQAGVKDTFVDFDPPLMFAEDIGKKVHAIVEGTVAFPRLGECEELEKLLLMHLGVNNVDEVFEKLGKAMKEAGTYGGLAVRVHGLQRQLAALIEMEKKRELVT